MKTPRNLPCAWCAFLAVCVLSAATLGQDYSFQRYQENPARYSKTLAELLKQAETDLEITIEYSEKTVGPYLERLVPQAPWKAWSDPELRLAYILAPLDLSFEKTGDATYRVFEPWYYVRPESEGAAHLQRLLRLFPDLDAWKARREALRTAILDRMEYASWAKCELNPVLTDPRSYDGYTVRNVSLQIFPKVYLAGTLYLPADLDTAAVGKYPAVLCPHGHGVKGRTGEDQQLRAGSLARMGAVVFAYSMFAWHAEESPLAATRDAHRDPISGVMQTRGSMRVLDFVTSLPYVDVKRIGITGCSGGGTQTFVATALDDRIAVSVPVVMVSSHFFGGCPCESGLPWHIDCGGTCNAEIAAMAAPRPMLVVGVTQDWTKNVPEVEFPYLQKIYGYYGASENVEYAYFDEPHNYGKSKRDAMYPFMAKHLGLDLTQLDESRVTVEDPALMFVPYPEDGVQTLDALKAQFRQNGSTLDTPL